MFKTLIDNFLRPLVARPHRVQVAALCWRDGPQEPELLLITSLETKRWILPKGWPKAGYDGAGMAAQEAWEEAGVKPVPGKDPVEIGEYSYDKRLKGGVPVRTDVTVYTIEVETLEENFPEAGKRDRRWFTPRKAAQLVREPELKALLLALPDRMDDQEPTGKPA